MKWLDTNEYPFQARFLNFKGQQVHYIDEGSGDVLLFVHGTPSWSFDFRHVIKQLSPHYRCIAFDHIGFGLSTKPKDYDYSISSHTEVLDALVDYLGLRDITLVLHDFGGPIGFNFAINHPQLVRRFVVMNSWLWSSAQEPEFRKLQRILKSPLLPFLYLNLNFSARFILPASFGDHKLSKKMQRQFTSPFSSRNDRYGTLGFAKSLLNDQDFFESLWERREVICEKPTLFIWGMKDKFVTPRYLNKFKDGFRNAGVVKIESAGHFPQEENPAVVANAINEFMKSRLIENNGTVSINENTFVKH